MVKALTIGLFMVAVGFAAMMAQAEEPAAKKQNVMNFEEELIEGEKKSPDLQHVLTQKSRNFNKLVRMRENFSKEMTKTGNDVK